MPAVSKASHALSRSEPLLRIHRERLARARCRTGRRRSRSRRGRNRPRARPRPGSASGQPRSAGKGDRVSVPAATTSQSWAGSRMLAGEAAAHADDRDRVVEDPASAAVRGRERCRFAEAEFAVEVGATRAVGGRVVEDHAWRAAAGRSRWLRRLRSSTAVSDSKPRSLKVRVAAIAWVSGSLRTEATSLRIRSRRIWRRCDVGSGASLRAPAPNRPRGRVSVVSAPVAPRGVRRGAGSTRVAVKVSVKRGQSMSATVTQSSPVSTAWARAWIASVGVHRDHAAFAQVVAGGLLRDHARSLPRRPTRWRCRRALGAALGDQRVEVGVGRAVGGLAAAPPHTRAEEANTTNRSRSW